MKRKTLTRQAVVREALALVDAEGLEALSMRRLAERLGVEAMSLYNHVSDKADLLDGLKDALMAGLSARARGGDWRALLSRMASEMRAALLAHPALIPLVGGGPSRSAQTAAPVERARAALQAAGFSPRAATRAIHAVSAYALGHVVSEAHDRADGDFRYGLDAFLEGISRRRK